MREHRKRVMRFRALVIIFCFISIVTLSYTSVVTANVNKKASYKYYTSVQIEPGDSLWSIANQYAAQTELSINDYIKEVKALNNLSSDKITAGQKLMVFYISSEYK
jgi:LysM repeat protein